MKRYWIVLDTDIPLAENESGQVQVRLIEHLLSRVSVLMPMSSDSFLDGIGYKFCDEVYYVLK